MLPCDSCLACGQLPRAYAGAPWARQTRYAELLAGPDTEELCSASTLIRTSGSP